MSDVTPEIIEAAQDFENWYGQIQNLFDVQSHPLSGLVTGVENRERPIHRWYSLKEAYSGDLPTWIINYLDEKYQAEVQRVLDPFVGGGTTGVTLAQHGYSVDGLEYNPFIYFVSKTKSQYPLLRRNSVCDAIRKIDLKFPLHHIDIPRLSTLYNEEYFRFSDLQILLHVVNQIRDSQIDESIQNLLLLGVAASIEPVANLRKDGRALRFQPNPDRPTADIVIQDKWNQMVEDLESLVFTGNFCVYHGTAVDLPSVIQSPVFDLVLYSPPYLNNFDYSEIYKLELWMLDFIKTKSEWQELRRSTIRSHPSVQFVETSYLADDAMMCSIYNMLLRMESSKILLGERSNVSKIIVGYFDDMYQALKQQWHVLKPGGFLVFIVANSRHKFLPIATDLILGAIAKEVGFEPLEILILKQRNGRTRQKAYLRESAVIMRKPMID